MFSVARWNLLSRAVAGNPIQGARSTSFEEPLKVAGLFLFLLPLIIILGTIDSLTDGRSQHWP